MHEQILPEKLPGISERIYGGFWRRFGALWLDVLITLPVTIGVHVFDNMGRLNYLYSLLPVYIFYFFYNVYSIKRWGGSPGKLISGLVIIRKDGMKAGWKEAILRNIVGYVIAVFSVVCYVSALFHMSDSDFSSFSYGERANHLMALMPAWHAYVNWANQIWIWSEFVVLLTNARRRALHDFIAGTVVIKKKFREDAARLSGAGGEEDGFPIDSAIRLDMG